MRNRFETLQVLDYIETMSQIITDMIQQSTTRVANAINKPLQSRISLPTRALMKKRREMAGNGGDKQHIEYAEISNIITKKAREDQVSKYNQGYVKREMIIALNSQYRLITLLGKQDRKTHDDRTNSRWRPKFKEPRAAHSLRSIVLYPLY